MPDVPIALFTDAARLGIPLNGVFDPVVELESVHRRSKVDCLMNSPFERTLFLDGDVSVLEDVSELFDLLERFDIAGLVHKSGQGPLERWGIGANALTISETYFRSSEGDSPGGRSYEQAHIAMAHAHARNRAATRAVWTRALPDTFPQFNTGVVVFRRTPQTHTLLRAWSDSYQAAGFRKDQVTLRELLWASDLRLATLPPEYNIRYPKYLWLWGRREARPRICHFRRYSFVDRSEWLIHLGQRMIGWPRRLATGLLQSRREGDVS
jgi:hypothetical protein